MDAEMQAFAQDVPTSIQPTQRGEGRVHQVPLSAAAEARAKVGLTQTAFAQLMGVSVRTLQNWEQGQFIRFHGLIQWMGWLWPFVLLAYLMQVLAAPRTSKMAP